jgi:ABC-type branched-subunit amino acid transport system substrate-binding protein
MMMAIKHFNEGDGVVIPEIHEIDQQCPIRLSTEFVDSKYTPAIVVQSLTKIMESRDPSVFTQDPVPCAVVGARTSSATGPGAVVSGVFDLPHMSYTATSPELNDPFRYPLFSRLITSDEAAAKAGLRFMKEVQGSSHIAVMYIDDPFGIEYNKGLLNEALRLQLTVRSFPLAFPPDPENIKQVVKNVKETGYRHIYLIVFSSFIESVMLEAYGQGITGPDFSYLLGISTSFFDDATYTAEQAKAFEGMAILPEFGAKPRTDGYDRFVQKWNQQNADDVAYYNTKLPVIAGKNGTECFQAEPDFFTNTNYDTTGDTAPFAYDTVVAIGLGACNAYQESQEQTLEGKSHASSIVGSPFTGATGYILMDPTTRARDPLSFSYAVLNVQSSLDTETGMVTFETPESFLIQPNIERTDWLIEKTGSFFYNDGSEEAPPSLPEIKVDYNWIGGWRFLGHILSGVIMWISIALAGWTWQNRESRAVRLSQPPFLIMICVGTFIIASMLIPLSMDDENFGERATDIA